MMFGSGEVDFYLKTKADLFISVVQDDHQDIIFKEVKTIREATLFDRAMKEALESTGTLVDEAIGTPEVLKKIYITTLEYLYYCAIADLASLKENPRPTYMIIDEIIALGKRIPMMAEMLDEIETAAREKLRADNPKYIISVNNISTYYGFVKKIKGDEVEFIKSKRAAKKFTKHTIDEALEIVKKTYDDSLTNIIVRNIN